MTFLSKPLLACSNKVYYYTLIVSDDIIDQAKQLIKYKTNYTVIFLLVF